MDVDLISPEQKRKLRRGKAMKPYISPATRAKCVDCNGMKFKKKKSREYINEIPRCISCGSTPNLFRVSFNTPIIGTNSIQLIQKTTDDTDKRLDTASRADSFCEFIKDKFAKDGNNFDPRTIGNKSQRNSLLIKNCMYQYLEYQKDRVGNSFSDKLTPGGYAKKERVVRLYMIPIFGEYSFSELSYQVLSKQLLSYKYVNRFSKRVNLSDSIKTEIIKELGPIFSWAEIEGFTKYTPEFPKKIKSKKFKAADFYTLEERNLVINNIDKKEIRIAITILANYTRRKSEVICLRWGDINFKKREITFSRHISDGKGAVDSEELGGLKSSPDSSLKYDFFPGLYEMLMGLTPSLNNKELVFKGKSGEILGKNALYQEWSKSAKKLIMQKKLSKFVDLHRGTRNSTLSALFQNGVADSILVELYGGDMKTMKDHYAKKYKQNLGANWKESEHLVRE
jgi:integrase